MTEYYRMRMWLDVSEHSDYHSPRASDALEYTESPTAYDPARHISVATGGSTVDLANYTTAEVSAVIMNTDSTNYVSAAYTDPEGAITARIPAGGIIIAWNMTTAADLVLTANTAACICKVWLFGTAA